MPTYKFVHAFQGAGGDSQDQYVNTFYMFHPTVTPAEVTTGSANPIMNAVNGFYDNTNGVGQAVSEYLSPRVRGVGAFVKVYTMGTGPQGSPLISAIWDESPVTHTPDVQSLPEECAVCLSYSALNSGVNRARRRGRVYIGPLNIAAMDDLGEPEDPVRVAGPFINILLDAAEEMKNTCSTAGWDWRVFSQSDGLGFNIQTVSVDDAFDTIRGRGTKPLTRISRTI